MEIARRDGSTNPAKRNSYASLAREDHRQELDISDRPDPADLTSREFILHQSLRQAVLKAYSGGLTKTQIAAVVQRTLKDHAFQANVRP